MDEGSQRGDVLVVRRRLGFGAANRREHFVVVQSNMLRELATIIVAPLDDDLPVYSGDPLICRVTKREAGTATPQVVLVAHLRSVFRDRFEPSRVGRLRAATMVNVDKLLSIALEL